MGPATGEAENEVPVLRRIPPRLEPKVASARQEVAGLLPGFFPDL